MSINQKSIEILIEEFTASLKRKGMAPGTIEGYLYETRQFLRWLEVNGVSGLDEITRETIRKYQDLLYHGKNRRGGPFSVSTQICKIHAVKAFLQTMSEESRILFNPAEDIQLPRQEQRLPRNILNEKEYTRLIRAVKGNSPELLRDRLIFELMYLTGIRIAELAGIKLDDIDYEHSALRIDKGKGGKTRFIPLMPKTIRKIRRYAEEARPKLLRGKQSDKLLINNSAKAIQRRMTVNKYLRGYLKKAGIRKKITAHCFRHTFATALLKNGAPLRHIQRLLGHDSIKTTLIYTHLSIEDLKKSHHKFHPFEEGGVREVQT